MVQNGKSPPLPQVGLQVLRAGGVPQAADSLLLDLANPLPGQIELLGDFLERLLRAAYPEEVTNDIPLPIGQRG